MSAKFKYEVNGQVSHTAAAMHADVLLFVEGGWSLDEIQIRLLAADPPQCTVKFSEMQCTRTADHSGAHEFQESFL